MFLAVSQREPPKYKGTCVRTQATAKPVRSCQIWIPWDPWDPNLTRSHRFGSRLRPNTGPLSISLVPTGTPQKHRKSYVFPKMFKNIQNSEKYMIYHVIQALRSSGAAAEPGNPVFPLLGSCPSGENWHPPLRSASAISRSLNYLETGGSRA